MARPFEVLVYGDVDLNVIDGSSVWLQSLVRMLQRLPRAEVTLQLKRNPHREVLVAPLRALERVRIVSQPENEGRRLLAHRAPRVLAELDEAAGGFDAIVLRGYRLCVESAGEERLAGRLWCYLTDLPQDPDEIRSRHREELEAIAVASRYLLCQTDELRSFFETHFVSTRGKTALLRPVVDDMSEERPSGLGTAQGARIVYAGKFAPRWRTEELLAALPQIRKSVPAAEVVAVGDKIHDVPEDPAFSERMRSALENTAGLEWIGGRSRREVQEIIADADFGYSVRDRSLDASLELSTKVLEYGRGGVPALLARTQMHERLLGRDYPLFVADDEDLGPRLKEVLDDPEAYGRAAEAAWRAAQRHTMSAVAADLELLVASACPDPVVNVHEPRRLLVVGHDLKFTTPLVDHLGALPNVELRLQEWDGVNKHDEKVSRSNLTWADSILAEWCLGNAVWFGRHRLPGQRLVSRFHLFERDTPYPTQLEEGQVDHVAFVGPHILEEMEPRIALSRDSLSVVPNAVPTAHLRRPKLPGARFNLGILGISPWRKRLDLAVETLRLAREHDERFTLFVKGHLPIDYWWIWGKERDRYLELTDRIATDPVLRGSVVFDGFGSDVSEWFRKIGFILSPSDFESFHLAAAEGIASGAVPVIWCWEGAAEIYPAESLVASPQEAAAAIMDAVAAAENRTREDQALSSTGDRYVLEVCRTWERLLLA
jgi:glycosyltransferase involved in cell wall biosynthesis